MRLIDTKNYKLHEFFESRIPPYAILSHTWGNPEDEISYAEFRQREKDGSFDPQSKLIRACQLALFESWDWLWIDTCCIDKSSSADLTESINSMFKWYEDAGVCYIYLADVKLNHSGRFLPFKQSKWFTRGWTLQELLAPSNAVFLDCNWEAIGTKASLGKHISSRTGIAGEHLFDYRSASIAQKMSWAAHRTTTRVEDTAYCLLGIFEVNMTLIYGEGERAFQRLQENIISRSTDHSIFAWVAEEDKVAESLLARNPFAFRKSGQVSAVRNNDTSPTSFSISNAGLSISLCLFMLKYRNVSAIHSPEWSFKWAQLTCFDYSEREFVLIRLHRERTHYYRYQDAHLHFHKKEAEAVDDALSLTALGMTTVQIMSHDASSASHLLTAIPRVTRIKLSPAALMHFVAFRCKFDNQSRVVFPRENCDLDLPNAVLLNIFSPSSPESSIILIDMSGMRLSLRFSKDSRIGYGQPVTIDHPLLKHAETIYWLSPHFAPHAGAGFIFPALIDSHPSDGTLRDSCLIQVDENKSLHIYLRLEPGVQPPGDLCVHVDIENRNSERALAEILA